MSDSSEKFVAESLPIGFRRWVRLSMDDLPLIRPPKHHMLAHVTGGLTKLYDIVTELKDLSEKNSSTQMKDSTFEVGGEKTFGETKYCGKGIISKDHTDTQTKLILSDTESASHDDKDKSEEQQHGKKDDEGGGFGMKNKKLEENASIEEDEETTPYTDEMGEFAPVTGMPLLAGRYKFLKVLARGQSALIIKAQDTFCKDRSMAIKVLHRVYKPIGSQEADILLELHRGDPFLHVPFARLQNQFIYGPHYCLVFEYLSPTPLYTHYDQRDIREIKSLPHVRSLTVKLLTVLGFLYKQNVIHADLKPENILLRDEEDTSSVMVVDFGNALRNTDEELSLYYSDFELQTLLYRAPEVIFGMKFSLEVDMWSLGCMLAECYLGEPLFMGKTKHDILVKITKLLGPFPREFSEGECAEEFLEFIGRPFSRYQRIENIKKRLNNCNNMEFILLLDRLLTYLPEHRVTPFEAACHPFVAPVSPFLYLTPSPGYVRYPTVVLDISTYPYLPGLPSDEDESSVSASGRKRLASFAKQEKPSKISDLHSPPPAESQVLMQKPQQNVAEQEIKESPEEKLSNEHEKKLQQSQQQMQQVQKQQQQQQQEQKQQHQQEQKQQQHQKPLPQQQYKQQQLQQKQQPEQSQTQLPITAQALKDHSPTQKTHHQQQQLLPQTQPRQQVQIQTKPHLSGRSPLQTAQIGKEPQSYQKRSQHLASQAMQSGQLPPGNVSRADVKETLKSMGLRCEDFTISVYSREQAHAILRKQGVEVTNHSQTRMPNVSKQSQPSQKTQKSDEYRPSVSVSRPNSKQPVNPPPKKVEEEDDDDDDCIILDPPEGPKPPPPPPPPPRLPLQFQLMGTTVQVNRGAKRQLQHVNPQMAKRPNTKNTLYYSSDSLSKEDPNSEASVQDTLKRLKNYNISITCRRNATPLQQRCRSLMDSDSDMDAEGSHIDSDEEADMAKYLECEIGEEEEYDGDDMADEEMDYDDLEVLPNSANNVRENNPSGKYIKSTAKADLEERPGDIDHVGEADKVESDYKELSLSDHEEAEKLETYDSESAEGCHKFEEQQLVEEPCMEKQDHQEPNENYEGTEDLSVSSREYDDEHLGKEQTNNYNQEVEHSKKLDILEAEQEVNIATEKTENERQTELTHKEVSLPENLDTNNCTVIEEKNTLQETGKGEDEEDIDEELEKVLLGEELDDDCGEDVDDLNVGHVL